MDYGKQFRSFINSYYVGEGVRMTIGILLPSIIAAYFNALPIGINISLGALGIAISDNPGPILHRKNGFFAGSILLFLVAILVGLSSFIPWLYGIILPILCFIFSIIGVFGTRAASIGVAALLILVLQADHHYKDVGNALLISLYIGAGAVWYSFLSLALYQLRPYKIVQQSLGEYFETIGKYLKTKGNLFNSTINLETTYSQLLQLQTTALERQNLTAEIIFKTRSFVKESTPISRNLMLAFLDVTDLLDTIMTSHQDYKTLHSFTPAQPLLQGYMQCIQQLGNYLEETGIALKGGTSTIKSLAIEQLIQPLRNQYAALHANEISSNSISILISLKQILDSIEAVAARIKTLETYISNKEKISRKKIKETNPEDFISHQRISIDVIIDNLSFQSNIFRHSLRIALAALSAYIIAHFFLLGHSYWLLLTVIVILKPAYNLTKKRNKERLTGTLIGAAVGAALLYFIHSDTLLLIILTISMFIAYSFMRTNYIISVIAITVYVLLLYHLLNFNNYRLLITDRVIDTAIGSALAIVFSFILPPIWENTQLNNLLYKAINSCAQYFQALNNALTGNQPYEKNSIRLLRKESWISASNVSDSFNRMLSEPKHQQIHLPQIHQLVVVLYMANAHLATLNYYASEIKDNFVTPELNELGQYILKYLHKSAQQLQTTNVITNLTNDDKKLDKHFSIHLKINELLAIRNKEIETGHLNSDTRSYLSTLKSITDQYSFLYNISIDMAKITAQLK